MKSIIVGVIVLVGIIAGTFLGATHGAGELWIYERGAARCLNVASVTFYSARTASYKLADGTVNETSGPLEYYPGRRCNGGAK